MNTHSQPLSRSRSPILASALQSQSRTTDHSPSQPAQSSGSKKVAKRQSKARASKQARASKKARACKKGRASYKKAKQTLPAVEGAGTSHLLPTLRTAPRMTNEGQNPCPHLITVEGHASRYYYEKLPHPFTLGKGLKLDPSKGVLENITRLYRELGKEPSPEGLATMKLGVYYHEGWEVDLEHFEAVDALGGKYIRVAQFEEDYSFLILFKYPKPVREIQREFEEEKKEAIVEEDADMSMTESEKSSEQEDEKEGFVISKSTDRNTGSSLSQQQEVREKLKRVLDTQHLFLREVEAQKVGYVDLQAFQEELIDQLNQITADEDLPHFFSSTSDPTKKYLSLKCSRCEQSAYIWFNFDTDPEKTTFQNITFNRFPYGHGLHLNIDSHLNPRTKKKREGKKPVVPPKEGSKVKKSRVKKPKAKK